MTISKFELIEFNKLTDSINNIFKNIDDDTKNLLLLKGIKTRKRNITFSDAMVHSFKYVLENDTKKNITSSLNFKYDMDASRVAFHKKAENIPIKIYKEIEKKLQILYYNNTNNVDVLKKIAVDGTYNNINIKCDNKALQTSLNMCGYDVDNCVPIFLENNGVKTKNQEILMLKQYITKNNVKNTIFHMI